ncbi:MAG: KEOPS complex subunit Cgi121 [Candidatus Thermoplasmatota archaeon]
MEVVGAAGRVADSKEFLVRLRRISAHVIAFDADAVLGRLHLISAWERAKRAFDRERGMCNHLEMEVICYAAAQRRISAALSRIGIRDGVERIALLGPMEEIEKVLRDMNLRRDDAVIEANAEKLKRLGLSDPEIIFEQMSLMELGG